MAEPFKEFIHTKVQRKVLGNENFSKDKKRKIISNPAADHELIIPLKSIITQYFIVNAYHIRYSSHILNLYHVLTN
jgi:hypothetical protein